MAHDTDIIREIVTDIDRILAAVRRLQERASNGDQQSLGLAVVKLKEGRFWLRDVGHGSHMDAPTDQPT